MAKAPQPTQNETATEAAPVTGAATDAPAATESAEQEPAPPIEGENPVTEAAPEAASEAEQEPAAEAVATDENAAARHPYTVIGVENAFEGGVLVKTVRATESGVNVNESFWFDLPHDPDADAIDNALAAM